LKGRGRLRRCEIRGYKRKKRDKVKRPGKEPTSLVMRGISLNQKKGKNLCTRLVEALVEGG